LSSWRLAATGCSVGLRSLPNNVFGVPGVV
jgi:hypothetical protein